VPPVDPGRRVAVVAAMDQLEALRRVRDAETRRFEARIAHLEALLPQLHERQRRVDELTAALEAEQTARGLAEERAGILAEQVEVLQRSIAAERERVARLTGTGDRTVPADPYRVWEERFRRRIEEARTGERERMQGRLDALGAVLEEKEQRISALAAVLRRLAPDPGTGPDDLTRIAGIGPRIAEILRARGITTFAQIASLRAEDAAELGEALPVYPGRMIADRWAEQARDILARREQLRRLREGAD
jgi:predicted flap endonuclease-1-like 5' DNA nuclease